MEVKSVPWSIFTWVVTIAGSLLGFTLMAIIKFELDLQEVKTNVAVVRTDMAWVKDNLMAKLVDLPTQSVVTLKNKLPN